MSRDERQKLLREGGFTLDVPADHGLAMKAELRIPWNKLRDLRRQGNNLL